MTDVQSLIADIEKAAVDLGIAPSTIGKDAGQGGHFYARLKRGCRTWPDTAASVRKWISEEYKRRGVSI